MLYNNYRSTRAVLKEEERQQLSCKYKINPKERLMNLQKRKN